MSPRDFTVYPLLGAQKLHTRAHTPKNAASVRVRGRGYFLRVQNGGHQRKSQQKPALEGQKLHANKHAHTQNRLCGDCLVHCGGTGNSLIALS